MVSQGDLVRATIKKISKKTKEELNKKLASQGVQAGSAFLTRLIAQKTGLPQAQAAVIGGIIAKRAVKEIRDKLKS